VNPDVMIMVALCATAIILSGMGMLYSYMINKEKIKADAAVKAEEIRARNQLELEKLTLGLNEKFASNNYISNNTVKDIYEETHEIKVKEKLR
jgi:hypothetical protein